MSSKSLLESLSPNTEFARLGVLGHMASFGLEVKNDTFTFMEDYEIHGDTLQKSLDEAARVVLRHISSKASEYLVFSTSNAHIKAIVPRKLLKSGYLLEINTFSLVVDIYADLEDLHALQGFDYKPWYRPQIFSALDGRNDWNNLHGIIDFKNHVIIAREGSRLSMNHGPKWYRHRQEKSGLVDNPIEIIARHIGVSEEKNFPTNEMAKRSAVLARQFLQKNFFS